MIEHNIEIINFDENFREILEIQNQNNQNIFFFNESQTKTTISIFFDS